MILQDKKLLLRGIEQKDSEVLLELINSPEVEKNVIGWSFPVSSDKQKEWIDNLDNNDTIRYMIIYEGETIGLVSISSINFKNRSANINVKLLKKARGKGIAKNTINLMLNYCFNELNLHIVTANILEYNTPSRNLFSRLGFKQDGVLRDRIYKIGNYQNITVYSILKEEFYERNRK